MKKVKFEIAVEAKNKLGYKFMDFKKALEDHTIWIDCFYSVRIDGKKFITIYNWDTECEESLQELYEPKSEDEFKKYILREQ